MGYIIKKPSGGGGGAFWPLAGTTPGAPSTGTILKFSPTTMFGHEGGSGAAFTFFDFTIAGTRYQMTLNGSFWTLSDNSGSLIRIGPTRAQILHSSLASLNSGNSAEVTGATHLMVLDAVSGRLSVLVAAIQRPIVEWNNSNVVGDRLGFYGNVPIPRVAVANPAGGIVIDVEARAQLVALLGYLRNGGLLAP